MQAVSVDTAGRHRPALVRTRRRVLARPADRPRELRKEGRVDRAFADVRVPRGFRARRSHVAPCARGVAAFRTRAAEAAPAAGAVQAHEPLALRRGAAQGVAPHGTRTVHGLAAGRRVDRSAFTRAIRGTGGQSRRSRWAPFTTRCRPQKRAMRACTCASPRSVVTVSPRDLQNSRPSKRNWPLRRTRSFGFTPARRSDARPIASAGPFVAG